MFLPMISSSCLRRERISAPAGAAPAGGVTFPGMGKESKDRQETVPPIEAAAAIGRGGATERLRACAAPSQTADAKPVRSATTRTSLPAKEGRFPLHWIPPPAYVAWFRYSVKNSRETVLRITESGEDGGSVASSISADRTSMNRTPSGAPRQLPRRGSLNLNGNRPFLPLFSVSPGG